METLQQTHTFTKIYAHVYVESAKKFIIDFVQKEESNRFPENFLALRITVAYTEIRKVSTGFLENFMQSAKFV